MASKQYLILNNQLKRIGTLSIDGATVFTSDTITHQYASSDQTNSSYGDNPDAEDTTQSRSQNRKSKEFNHYGTIVVPQGQPDSPKVIEGNYIAKHDEVLGRWYIFRIWHTSETLLASGQAATSAEIIDLGLWELAHNIVPAKTFSNVSAKVAFEWLAQKLTWELDTSKLDTTLTMSELQFDGTSRASSMLQTLLQDYDLECDFYCEATSNGTITRKVFEVGSKLNSEIYSGTVFVGQNVTGCSRDITGNIITKLYVFGPNGQTMANANGGKTYIVDDDANRAYNPNWRSTYLEGAYTTSTTTDARGLKAIAKTILADTNHPQYSYTVTIPHDMHPILGSTIRTINTDFTPEMATKERVMATTESLADPSQNSVQFGEFQTVTRITPSWLSSFTNEIANAVQRAMQDSSSIDPVVLTPDGLDFDSAGSSKRVIIEAYEGGTNISAYLDQQGFILRHLQKNGQYGATTTGYLQTVTGQLGEYRASIDNDYFSVVPEVAANQIEAKLLGTISPTARGRDATEQYVVKLSDGTYLSSTAWPDASHSLDGHGDDTLYQHWQSDGKTLIDDMQVASGGHGSSFGVKEENGAIWIYGVTKNYDSASARFRLCKFKYHGGKDIESTVKSDTPDFMIGLTFSSSIRVNYDAKHDLIGLTRSDGHYEVIKAKQALAGDHDILYRIDMTQYNFDLNKQTFQSSCLDFPYIYWHSGDLDMHDYRMLYCVNCIHQGKEFELNYDFSSALPLKYDQVEPETIWMQSNGRLLASFNCHSPQDGAKADHIHAMFEIPVATRSAITLSKGAIPE